MNNNTQKQQQKPAQGASSKASRAKPKGIPSGVWKEIPLKRTCEQSKFCLVIRSLKAPSDIWESRSMMPWK